MLTVEIDELNHLGEVIELTPAEHRVLAGLTQKIGVEWLGAGRVRVYSKGLIGSAVLSGETMLRIVTKVPIANLLLLAGLAFQTSRLPTSVGSAMFTEQAQELDWFAVLLVGELEVLVRQGLRNSYVVVEEDLPYVRGRIRFNVARALSHPGMVGCEYADLLPDTPENRLIRTVLEVLATRHLLPGLRGRVDQLLMHFDGVGLERPHRRLIDECRITRVNQHYGPILRLCEVFLEQLGLEGEPGHVMAPSFFFDLIEVFEAAIGNLLVERIPQVRLQRSHSHQPIDGKPNRTLTYIPDILIDGPGAGLVLDTKYSSVVARGQYGSSSYKNAHIYQAAFYGLSLGCPAVLIYPDSGGAVDVTYDIKGVQVTLLTVNLAVGGLSDLDRLVDRVYELASGVAAEPHAVPYLRAEVERFHEVGPAN